MEDLCTRKWWRDRAGPSIVMSLSVACNRPAAESSPPVPSGLSDVAAAESSAEPTPAESGAVTDGDPGATSQRVLALDPSAAHFARLEGEGSPNDCSADAECFAGGCSGEVCSAESDLTTTCDALVTSLPAGAKCGCVQQACRWYVRPGGPFSGVEIGSDPPLSNVGVAPDADVGRCGEQMCKPGYTCVEYFGVAGPRGPKFESCELPCDPIRARDCPAGLQCITIADGPGSVCR